MDERPDDAPFEVQQARWTIAETLAKDVSLQIVMRSFIALHLRARSLHEQVVSMLGNRGIENPEVLMGYFLQDIYWPRALIDHAEVTVGLREGKGGELFTFPIPLTVEEVGGL